jgi:hypothetical protein
MPTLDHVLGRANMLKGIPYVFGAPDYPYGELPPKLDCAAAMLWILGESIPEINRSTFSYTGAVHSWAERTGRRHDLGIIKPRPGDLLLRRPGYKGIAIGHIGMFVGGTQSFEARSSKAGTGVFEAFAGRTWQSVVTIDEIDRENSSFLESVAACTSEVLGLASTGPCVLLARTLLTNKGFASVGSKGSEMNYSMQFATKNFQRSRALRADGIIGPKTWAALLA